ncbi:hypothetical protein ATANTOWER_009488 [Ataeniobius toweri]|uniref:Uncharacterized protein n=1 Tax=Ataeniobius toweri TaxID=208326 RepID=A0ABU7BC13_9TELE|nr:hypothetical protein [Ataeniobius toweri]
MNTNKRAELRYGSSMNPLLHLKALLLSSYYLNIIKFLTTFTETCNTLSSASRRFFWIPQTSGNSCALSLSDWLNEHTYPPQFLVFKKVEVSTL